MAPPPLQDLRRRILQIAERYQRLREALNQRLASEQIPLGTLASYLTNKSEEGRAIGGHEIKEITQGTSVVLTPRIIRPLAVYLRFENTFASEVEKLGKDIPERIRSLVLYPLEIIELVFDIREHYLDMREATSCSDAAYMAAFGSQGQAVNGLIGPLWGVGTGFDQLLDEQVQNAILGQLVDDGFRERVINQQDQLDQVKLNLITDFRGVYEQLRRHYPSQETLATALKIKRSGIRNILNGSSGLDYIESILARATALLRNFEAVERKSRQQPTQLPPRRSADRVVAPPAESPPVIIDRRRTEGRSKETGAITPGMFRQHALTFPKVWIDACREQIRLTSELLLLIASIQDPTYLATMQRELAPILERLFTALQAATSVCPSAIIEDLEGQLALWASERRLPSGSPAANQETT